MKTKLVSELQVDLYHNNGINENCDTFYDKINNNISSVTTTKNIESKYKRIKEWMTAGLCSTSKNTTQ